MGAAKISPQFDRRLRSLRPADRVQAILLLDVPSRGRRAGARTTAIERDAIGGEIATAGDAAVPEIDRILRDHGGRRLADAVNVLGSLPVETTPVKTAPHASLTD
jgi:hypothetical protein